MLSEEIGYFQVKTAGGPAELAVRTWRPVKTPKGRVVCLHEAACNSIEFAFLAEAFIEAGFEVIAPDFPGHGGSTYFNDPAAYSWIDFASSAGRIVRRYMTDDAHLLGASFGGAVLLPYMLAAKTVARSAVFVDIPLQRGGLWRRRTLSPMMDLIRSDFETLDGAKAHFAACRHPLHPDAAHLEGYLTENRFHRVDGSYRLRCDRYVMDFFDEARNAPQPNTSGNSRPKIEVIPELQCPSLFLHGADSRNLHADTFRDVSRAHPHLHFEVIAGAHPPPLTSFEQINSIVDFIRKQADR